MMYFPVSELKKKSDADLLHLFYQGHQNAIAVLLARYKSKICYHIFNYVKSKETTEDLYQDIVCKILLQLKKNRYIESGKFYAWILQIAKNQVIDYYRVHKNKKHIAFITNEDDEEINIFDILRLENTNETDVSKDIEQTEIKKTNKNIIRQLIDELPAEQKEVVILRMYYDMSFKEIAKFSNVSINTSLGRMRYALINLEKMIKEKSLDKKLLCG
ncbi:MAG TPA: RNA polymerase sigma factor [Bacteroidia bacterium]|nr:RNA polymerase sigma factor [Bacteroidia bacterium]